MSIGYQERDLQFVDYQLYGLATPKRHFVLRGPKPPLKPNSYITCVGGAFTYGCFVERPWPSLLQDALSFPCLNLGEAGAGPRFFNHASQDGLLSYINGGRIAIIMVMSGRSDQNSIYANEEGLETLTFRADGSKMSANAAYDKLLAEQTREEVMAIVTETRVNYVDQFKQLLSKITVPKILFWYSNRKPAYTEGFENANALYCGMPNKVPFPEFVNQEMIEALTREADEYVECITERGKPHKLVSRFTGLPVTISDRGRVISENVHYPSPEMHRDAALLLEPVCRKLLSR